MELIDILDENGIKTGEIISREEVHKKGLWHRAIVAAIINENNEILLQQRSANKEKNPNMWDISVAGHISAGQDSLQATIREISEEVNIYLSRDIGVKDFRFMLSYRKQQVFSKDFIENQFYDFFILRQVGINEKNIRFQSSEVQAIKFVDITTLNKMRENNELVERNECYDVLTEYLFKM